MNKSPMLLIGIGTAGSAIARGINRAFSGELRYVLADTDANSGSDGGPFVLLGGERLSGLGAGGDIVAGRLAAESSIKLLDEHLEGVRLAVIVTSLGGGTGGGATLEAAKHLAFRGIPSIVFASTPFSFEGEERQRNSRGIMSMIEDAASASFFLPLDKLVAGIDNMDEAMDLAISEGWAVKGTLAECAAFFGLDNLEKAVADYNAICEKGVDEQFYKASYLLKPLSGETYYVVESMPSIWGTFGGVKTDDYCRALTAKQEPIAGLYVAGVDNGSLYASPYYENEGASIGVAFTSGIVAAKYMAEYIKA
jgi:hypothetical protein